ncbi:hypothetical protein Daus18300_011500, partial [Diaporthe australafricana]
MGSSTLSWPYLAFWGAHWCSPVLSSIHTLYAFNFHNVSELYTLQLDDDLMEVNMVDSALADGLMVWSDFD